MPLSDRHIPEGRQGHLLIKQGLLFWLSKEGFKVSSGTVKWYRSSYGTDFDDPEIASLVLAYGPRRGCLSERRGHPDDRGSGGLSWGEPEQCTCYRGLDASLRPLASFHDLV